MAKKKSKLQKRIDNPNSTLWRNKADREWSIMISEKWQGKCAICGSDRFCQAHHLIPREMKSHRHNPNNGILLCASHHKYSFEISPHRASISFIKWLIEKHPKIWGWLCEQKPSRDSDNTCKELFELLKRRTKS